MRNAFFLFRQAEVPRLAQWLEDFEFGQGLEGIVSCLPGIDLSCLETVARDRGVVLKTIEDLFVEFKISQYDVSAQATELTNKILERMPARSVFPWLGFDYQAPLKNQLALLLHNTLAFDLALRRLVEQGLLAAQYWRGPERKFVLVERLDIEMFCRPDLAMRPHLVAVCAELGVKRISVGRTIPFSARLENSLRVWILRIYKAFVLTRRSWSTPLVAQSALTGAAKAEDIRYLFVIRAGTELDSARPILQKFAESSNAHALIFVDDLIKSPTGTKAVCNSGFDWVPAHGFSRIRDVFVVFFRSFWRIRCGLAQRDPGFSGDLAERKARFGFLGTTKVVRSSLKTACEIFFELELFARQLQAVIDLYRPHALITLDTVDRWGAVVGSIGADQHLPTLTIQNTSLDKIKYPLPLVTDHLVVACARLKEVMCASGAPSNRVHAPGLPQHDRLIRKGDKAIVNMIDRSEGGNWSALRMLVATQPFVQDVDYNAQLLSDLASVLRCLKVRAEIFIKPHPREAANSYSGGPSLFEGGTSLLPRIVRGTFEDALDLADIVISRTSTGIQLAILSGKYPVAYLRNYPKEIISRLDYLATPATQKVMTEDALFDFLDAFSNLEKRNALLHRFANDRKAYIAEFAGENAGQATEYVVALLSRMVADRAVNCP